ncbi:MAG: M20 family metallopeptidase [Alphaproteobacteria bacterium]|nr:M20 family metallopeptidase [Alphaproteobacteria bacterium]MBV9693085.1 M20 family metallopeptidase [Alphaproteobacteria bacterium]
MSLAALKKEAVAAVDAMRAELLALSHAIHGEPELALEEVKASQRLTGAVESHGVAVQRGAFGLKTAFAAEFGNSAGPTIAVLSEYDALPGIGHACGHNIIATAGLGAALALSKLNGLPGRVRYLGTPAEERYGGKELMAREGAFDRSDAAMMIHPSNLNLVTMPCIAVCDVSAVFHGRAAHASAMPYRGLNALDAVITAYQAIAQLRQHIRNTDRIHGIITEGGLAANIVPERAACRFFVRSVDGKELLALKHRVQACFEAGALATGCRVETKWGETNYLDLKTNWPMAEAYQRNAEALGLEFFALKDLPPGYAGSTDMGNVSHRVPSIHPCLGVAPLNVIIHNAEFARHAASDKADQAVIDGAKSMAMTMLDLMGDGALLASVKSDFAATAEASRAALAAAAELHDVAQAHAHGHAHAGCGCA